MIKKLLLLSFIMVTIASCMKEIKNEDVYVFDPEKQSQTDDSLILDYLLKNDIDYIKHEQGLYYTITKEGNGVYPSSDSNVEVFYKGYLLNGSVFDQSLENTITFPLNQVIQGWQIGIPLISYGGAGTLYIPSALGYGQNAVGSIPPNSVMIFDVELVDLD